MVKPKENFAVALASFLPRKIILSKMPDSPHEVCEKLGVVLLFADISGFTAMSEKLTRLGKAGAEEVNSIINRFFDPLIKIVYKWNGDIYRFGGDAFLVFFSGKRRCSFSKRMGNMCGTGDSHICKNTCPDHHPRWEIPN